MPLQVRLFLKLVPREFVKINEVGEPNKLSEVVFGDKKVFWKIFRSSSWRGMANWQGGFLEQCQAFARFLPLGARWCRLKSLRRGLSLQCTPWWIWIQHRVHLWLQGQDVHQDGGYLIAGVQRWGYCQGSCEDGDALPVLAEGNAALQFVVHIVMLRSFSNLQSGAKCQDDPGRSSIQCSCLFGIWSWTKSSRDVLHEEWKSWACLFVPRISEWARMDPELQKRNHLVSFTNTV